MPPKKAKVAPLKGLNKDEDEQANTKSEVVTEQQPQSKVVGDATKVTDWKNEAAVDEAVEVVDDVDEKVAGHKAASVLDFNEEDMRKLNTEKLRDFDNNTLFKVLYVRGKDNQNPTLAKIAKFALLDLNFERQERQPPKQPPARGGFNKFGRQNNYKGNRFDDNEDRQTHYKGNRFNDNDTDDQQTGPPQRSVRYTSKPYQAMGRGGRYQQQQQQPRQSYDDN